MILDEKNFEQHVIRVCNQVFSPYIESKVNYFLGEKEHDAYYEDDFTVHLVEITVSKKQSKTHQDLEKLSDAINHWEKVHRGTKIVRGWLVTQYELTPDQQKVLKLFSKAKIFHQSYNSLVSRIINSQDYLAARSNHRFGSAQNLFNDSFDFKEEIFVETSLRSVFPKTSGGVRLGYLKKWISNGTKKRVLLIGEFGSGKSMHMRELFRFLAKEHTYGKTRTFPISLNLRDFAELETPDEALRRHAERIGVRDLGERLIRAWRAGFSSLLIDGFDEVSPRVSAPMSRRLVDIRKQALLIVRRFISDSPSDTTIVLAGRSNFFPTLKEMMECLGLDDSWFVYRLEQLANETELSSFLDKYNARFYPPEWIPRLPLLLGYLAVVAQKEDISDIDSLSPSEGWRLLLAKFTKREVSQIDKLPLIEQDLFDIYGDIATKARKRAGGIGPISIKDMLESFRSVLGDDAEGLSLGQLLRMPGLVYSVEQRVDIVGGFDSPSDSESRVFISPDFVDVCSANHLSSYHLDYKEYRINAFLGLKSSISITGSELLMNIFSDFDANKYLLPHINKISKSNYAQIDLIQTMIWNGLKYGGKALYISGCDIDALDLDNIRSDVSRIKFENCYFCRIIIGYIEDVKLLPMFQNCAIELLEIHEPAKINESYFEDTEIDQILHLELDSTNLRDRIKSNEEKIFFDVLKKIYEQSGSGRLEKALFSGNAPHQYPVVEHIIDAMRSKKVIVPMSCVSSETLWKPVPSRVGEVRRYLAEPDERYFKSIVSI